MIKRVRPVSFTASEERLKLGIGNIISSFAHTKSSLDCTWTSFQTKMRDVPETQRNVINW